VTALPASRACISPKSPADPSPQATPAADPQRRLGLWQNIGPPVSIE
jgi:hypothetical protein